MFPVTAALPTVDWRELRRMTVCKNVGEGSTGASVSAIPTVKTQLGASLTKRSSRLPGKLWSIGASNISSSPEDSMFMVPGIIDH